MRGVPSPVEEAAGLSEPRDLERLEHRGAVLRALAARGARAAQQPGARTRRQQQLHGLSGDKGDTFDKRKNMNEQTNKHTIKNARHREICEGF